MQMLRKYSYLNGKIRPAKDPAILANDVGWLRGYGVFDFLRTYDGKIFHYADHYRRFANSAKLLDLKVKIKQADLEKIIYRLIKKNNLREVSIRLVLTGGPSPDGLNFNPQTPTLAVLIEGLYQLPTKLFQTGAKLITFNYDRLIPEAKNLNYIWAVKLQKEKKRQGATEILYTNKGKILECSTSNFFIVKNNKLITPKDNILLGVTRKVVIKLAPKLKLPVEERPLKIEELKTADEAFITATNKDILPIIKINSQKIGSGRPGPVTKQLMTLFEEYTRN